MTLAHFILSAIAYVVLMLGIARFCGINQLDRDP